MASLLCYILILLSIALEHLSITFVLFLPEQTFDKLESSFSLADRLQKKIFDVANRPYVALI